jgi:acyl-CoA synthetase (AMP-forming)/AMP-acid ligase II
MPAIETLWSALAALPDGLMLRWVSGTSFGRDVVPEVCNGEGYLTITGRLKELINRGGEKISPREVDDLLMSHPAVAQAVTFALPHDKLGEEVAAAIVLREGQSASERELRDFVSARLADFKVVFLPEIPKGPTGKLQRIGLAAKLGLSA